MANTKQAKKRAAQSTRRRARNKSVVTNVRNVVRKLRQTAETDLKKAGEMVSEAAGILDRAVRKGVLHKRTASRLKSRVARRANKKA